MKQIFYLVALVFSINQSEAYDPWDRNAVWTSHDGLTIWSGRLEKSHPNCISEKDSSGKPKLLSQNRVKCKKNISGSYLNAEKNGQDIYIESTTIQKSDATEACKKIGGILPTISDFESLQNDPDYYLFPDKEHYFISSTVRTRNNYEFALGLNGRTGNYFVFSVEKSDSEKTIRCIKK